MPHLPVFIQDLAFILVVAASVTLLFRRLKQPVVLGYILAGFLVGPHFDLFPTVVDQKSIRLWSEIGVIFLLFSLGLEFSFRKLIQLGGTASLTAVVEISLMLAAGYGLGRALDWSTTDSLFLAGCLAISSTTIILRTFEELKLKSQQFAQLVLGILVVEDIVAILLLILLSTLSVTQQFQGQELVQSIFKLFFFLSAWFLMGIFLIPSLFRQIRRWLNEETLLLLSIGMCFLTVVGATRVGFSPALGAFLMGSLLAESREGETIQRITQPLKQLFGAVFFVSVGMLVNPHQIVEHWPLLVLFFVLIVFGKTFGVTLGSLLAGQSISVSIRSGSSMTQIGEFSFIIAALGQTLAVTHSYLYPLIVAVSVATTITTPFFVKIGPKLASFIERRIPHRTRDLLSGYQADASLATKAPETGRALTRSLIKMVANGIVASTLFLVSSKVMPEILENTLGSSSWSHVLSLAISVFVSLPFFWAMAFHKGRSEKGSVSLLAIQLVRLVAAQALFMILVSEYLPFSMTLALGLILMVIFAAFLTRHMDRVYGWFEGRFLENLGEVTNPQLSTPRLAPWDSHLAWLTVSPNSSLAGKTLEEGHVRENYHVSIAMIERGHRRIPAPGRNDRLFPLDRIAVIGNDRELEHFGRAVEIDQEHIHGSDAQSAISLRAIKLKRTSPYVGKTLMQTTLKTDTHGLVVGIERAGERILNPDAHTRLEADDTLWIVGDPDRIDSLA